MQLINLRLLARSAQVGLTSLQIYFPSIIHSQLCVRSECLCNKIWDSHILLSVFLASTISFSYPHPIALQRLQDLPYRWTLEWSKKCSIEWSKNPFLRVPFHIKRKPKISRKKFFSLCDLINHWRRSQNRIFIFFFFFASWKEAWMEVFRPKSNFGYLITHTTRKMCKTALLDSF